MELINFLIFVVKVLGLIFVIGILFNLILDVVIIQPIHNREANRKKLEMVDALIKKIENGEDIGITDSDKKEIEK